MSHQPANEVVATMPTYRRTLSPNELSYFLPSRAYGLNDMCTRNGIHAPPSLISPQRLYIVWAIMRLRHSLMACRVDMRPGRYDEAEFIYTPPSNPAQALAEAKACIRVFHDVSGPELLRRYFNGSRTLSSECFSRMDVACHGRVAPGVHEFHFVIMYHHMINDTLAGQQTTHFIFELLAGPATPGGPPRTDNELAKILDDEWRQRWGGARHPHHAIVPATEVRVLGLARSKFCDAAWKVDNLNIQKKFIVRASVLLLLRLFKLPQGGHVFPRTKSPTTNVRLFCAVFDEAQTAAINAKCKAKHVTLANAVFGLCNFAWIRLCAAHPETNAPKDLPMLMYTALSIRRHLPPPPPLTSYMSLALEYHNVVLPAFLPTAADPRKMFWARSAAAQKQMFKHGHSPLMLRRAMVTNVERGERAKAWARIDDEADGTLPRTRRAVQAQPQAPAPNPKRAPALALLGMSNIGDLGPIYREEAYPLVTLLDMVGAARKAPGGLLVYTRTFKSKFNMTLVWEAAPFAPGLIEEFWGYVVDGVHEYVLEDPSLKGTAVETDCLVGTPLRARAKM
ncbi:hypothetical protein B0H16DRAFT_111074 [Mycena metata]|uniref:Uncharacterized protein n=1 Tax=Mycena metata TaxID=1033252 RepID=A0AAD7I7Q9_9AGAR|nr:hypothetical protein B0H16DRAFT_111074 [Mycena metata]